MRRGYKAQMTFRPNEVRGSDAMAVFLWRRAGWNRLCCGDLTPRRANGEDAAELYTASKVVVARWM